MKNSKNNFKYLSMYFKAIYDRNKLFLLKLYIFLFFFRLIDNRGYLENYYSVTAVTENVVITKP